MKKVIFLCFLSVSICVSKPANEGATQATSITLGSSVPPKVLETTTVPIPIPIPNLGTNGTIAQTVQNETKEAIKTVTPVTEKSSQPINNKTSEKKEEIKENSVTPTKNTPQEKPEEKSSTKTEEAVTPTATPSKEIPTKATSTVSPNDNATAHPIEGHPGFDGASFVGGIILTLGLLAISFMGFKYYKNHTERNYHTL